MRGPGRVATETRWDRGVQPTDLEIRLEHLLAREVADVAHGFGALRPLIIEPLVGDARDVDHPIVIRDPNPIEAEWRLGQGQLVGSENEVGPPAGHRQIPC